LRAKGAAVRRLERGAFTGAQNLERAILAYVAGRRDLGSVAKSCQRTSKWSR
jgi:hypothetical protein